MRDNTLSIHPIALALAFSLLSLPCAQAASPDLMTPAPVIYLADNLDEKDNLGFCLDTVGRGQSDRLHIHSCKPRGGDVQFTWDPETGHLASAAFDDLCVEVSAADASATFALTACRETAEQAFDHVAATGELRLRDTPSLCLTAGASSSSAGPFMSRSAMLSPCDATDDTLKTWIVKTE